MQLVFVSRSTARTADQFSQDCMHRTFLIPYIYLWGGSDTSAT
jgi:hypothetical protein